MTALDRALGWFIAPPAGPEHSALPHGAVPSRADLALTGLGGAEFRAAPHGVDPGAFVSEIRGADLVGLALERASVTSAAVLGRPREVEPVAAALALALRRDTRAKAATVVVVGGPPAEPAGQGGGGAAARRVAARLEASGHEPWVRGRLAWVRVDPRDAQLVATVRHVTLVAAPAVLAITAPRSPELDQALAEQDLLVLVTCEPDGPLARVATAGLPGVPIVTVPPLTRGPARALARAGVRPPAAIRRLVPPAAEQRR